MAFVHTLAVRFEDVDYARVVHFPRLLSYCHQAFEAFFPAELGLTYAQMIEERHLGFPMVHAEADFKAPFRLSETVRVVMETTKVGERSFSHRYRLHRGDSPSVAAQVLLVSALVSMPDFSPTTLPPDVRQALERHPAND